MKTVKNNRKLYQRREVVAAPVRAQSKKAKAEATEKFLKAPISADLYIDLRQSTERKL